MSEEFELTLVSPPEVIFRGTEPGKKYCKLTKITLIHETVRSDELARAVSSTFVNRVSLFYDYITLFKEITMHKHSRI